MISKVTDKFIETIRRTVQWYHTNNKSEAHNGEVGSRNLPSVTSPKLEKASFNDFSSSDHDKPAKAKPK